mmetsp:Transcript_4004/g.7869  ORF Transcript_4004/g.7869 Transcript_4004/m.7869 type:complete len:87 (+) Transcript_4004:870-1130(+)
MPTRSSTQASSTDRYHTPPISALPQSLYLDRRCIILPPQRKQLLRRHTKPSRIFMMKMKMRSEAKLNSFDIFEEEEDENQLSFNFL